MTRHIKIDTLITAMNVNELTDINNRRLLPKHFVAFRYGRSLYKGIILKINQKTTTILTHELGSKIKHTSFPDEQIIIDESLTDEFIKTKLLELYEEETHKEIIKDYDRYIICTYINLKTNIPGFIIFQYELTQSNRHNKNDWNKLLTKIEKMFPKNEYSFYVYSEKLDQFYLINSTAAVKNVTTYHKNDMGVLIKQRYAQDTLLEMIDNCYSYELTFDITKNTALKTAGIRYLNVVKHISANIEYLHADNYYITFLKDKRNSSFCTAWNNWLHEFNDKNLLRDFEKLPIGN